MVEKPVKVVKLQFVFPLYVILSEAAVGDEVEESFIFRCVSAVIGFKILRLHFVPLRMTRFGIMRQTVI